MNKYQVFVDVSNTWKEDDISVISLVVEANNAKDAKDNAFSELKSGKRDEDLQGREFYIWEVTEEDLLEDED